MNTLPPSLSKSYAVGLPSPHKKVAIHTQSILTLPPTDYKSYAVCPTPYQDMTFLKSMNFTTPKFNMTV